MLHKNPLLRSAYAMSKGELIVTHILEFLFLVRNGLKTILDIAILFIYGGVSPLGAPQAPPPKAS